MIHEIQPGEDILACLDAPRRTQPPTMEEMACAEAAILGARLRRTRAFTPAYTRIFSRLQRLRALYGPDIETAAGVQLRR